MTVLCLNSLLPSFLLSSLAPDPPLLCLGFPSCGTKILDLSVWLVLIVGRNICPGWVGVGGKGPVLTTVSAWALVPLLCRQLPTSLSPESPSFYWGAGLKGLPQATQLTPACKKQWRKRDGSINLGLSLASPLPQCGLVT